MSKDEQAFVVGDKGLDTDREEEIGQHIGYRLSLIHI